MPTRRILLSHGLAAGLLAATAVPAFARPGGLTSRDNARKKFGAAVASAYEVDAASIVVQPTDWGLPDNPFDDLAVGDLLAFRADLTVKGDPASVFGFASTRYAHPSFVRFVPLVGPGGIASLMEACNVLGAKPSLDPGGIVARIAWVYPGFGLPFPPPDGTWTAKRTKAGATIAYHVRTAEQTGVQRYWKVIALVGHDYATTVTREEIEWPEP